MDPIVSKAINQALKRSVIWAQSVNNEGVSDPFIGSTLQSLKNVPGNRLPMPTPTTIPTTSDKEVSYSGPDWQVVNGQAVQVRDKIVKHHFLFWSWTTIHIYTNLDYGP